MIGDIISFVVGALAGSAAIFILNKYKPGTTAAIQADVNSATSALDSKPTVSTTTSASTVAPAAVVAPDAVVVSSGATVVPEPTVVPASAAIAPGTSSVTSGTNGGPTSV